MKIDKETLDRVYTECKRCEAAGSCEGCKTASECKKLGEEMQAFACYLEDEGVSRIPSEWEPEDIDTIIAYAG